MVVQVECPLVNIDDGFQLLLFICMYYSPIQVLLSTLELQEYGDPSKPRVIIDRKH